jgi:hypothetical protein
MYKLADIFIGCFRIFGSCIQENLGTFSEFGKSLLVGSILYTTLLWVTLTFAQKAQHHALKCLEAAVRIYGTLAEKHYFAR